MSFDSSSHESRATRGYIHGRCRYRFNPPEPRLRPANGISEAPTPELPPRKVLLVYSHPDSADQMAPASAEAIGVFGMVLWLDRGFSSLESLEDICESFFEGATMPGRADQIAAEFPPNVAMPDELRQLCDFFDRTDYPLSGCMRLRPEGEGLKAWFGDGSDAWRQLAGFGSGPDGSILALWLYADSDAKRAPIVHLGSEGDHLMVIADSFREFLGLLAIGYDELGFDDLKRPPENPQTAKRLREWLSTALGIKSPETGIEIVKKAQSRHPNFEQWVISAQALRDSRTS